MTEYNQRSHVRGRSGPREVDFGIGSNTSRGNSHRHNQSDDREKHRTKRNNSHRPSNKDSGQRQKTSNTPRGDMNAEPPSFELNVFGQPSKSVQLGMAVEMSVMVSLKLPASDRVLSTPNVETSHLFVLTSLVTDTRDGQRMPLEAGSISGQKVYDSVHPFPEDCAATLARNQPCRLILGYSSFSELVIRQAGTYRIRTSLVKMGASAEGGATCLIAVDSEPIKVERHGSGTPRRHQRVYS